VKNLYLYATVGSKKIDDVKSYEIRLECLMMLRDNWRRFDKYTLGSEKEIIEDMLDSMNIKARKVKETSSEVLEAYIETLSNREAPISRELIIYFVNKVKNIVRTGEDPVEVMVCIRCFGYLASMVKRTLGAEDLKNHFLLLFEISQNRVLGDITDSYKNIDADAVQPENFKKILYRQKQLNSHIKAFALIVREMDELSDYHAKHLIDLLMIGVKKHKLFFEGYKKYLYEAIVQLINSLAVHGEIYKFWMKKVTSEMISSFVEMPASELNNYDRDLTSIKSSAEFIVRLLKQERWVEEVKKDFIKSILGGIVDFFTGSDFSYVELQESGKKLFVPNNNEDQHLTLRLALIFEEVQRSMVLDETLPEHFVELLTLTTRGISRYIRTSALQKMFKSQLSIAERLCKPLLEDSPETSEIIEACLEVQFSMLRELRGDILFDNLRCLLSIPTLMLKNNKKLIEVFKRSLLLTLETAGPQCIFMIDHAVTNLERVLVKEKVDLKPSKDKFLQEILPYFASLLDMNLEGTQDTSFTVTVQENALEREAVLKKCTSFLGGLGPDIHYIARGGQKENKLEQAEGDILKISIPIVQHKIPLNLNQIIKRASQLALESPNEDLQSAACELFHSCIVVIIGKCSQGSQAGEDFVDAIETSLPSIVKLSISSTQFSTLFKELLFQMSRWLAFNKDEENLLVSSFISGVLDLAGCGDKPEVRSLCLGALEQFLTYTCKIHLQVEAQVNNYSLLFRKLEAFTLHPDVYKRLAGIMSLRLIVSHLGMNDRLLQVFFFDVVYYFILFLRKQEASSGGSQPTEVNNLCEEMVSRIEQLMKAKASKLESFDNEFSKYSSVNDMFCSLQKNIFAPDSALREYSLRLWILVRNQLPQLLKVDTLATSLSFLDDSDPSSYSSDDPTLTLKLIAARYGTFSTLIEAGIVQERHLRESRAWSRIEESIGIVSQSTGEMVSEEVKRAAIMKLVQLAGLIRQQERDSLLAAVRNTDLVTNLIASAFNSKETKAVQTCKKVLIVLNVNIAKAIKDFVNDHEYRFDNYKDPIYSLTRKIPAKNIEIFFDCILQFLDARSVITELMNDVRVKVMLNFVKSTKNSSQPDRIARAKVFLQFLLSLGVLKETEIADFLDPFRSSYDLFSNLVKGHLAKVPETESQGLVNYLFHQSRKDHNIFTSIIELLSQFIGAGKSTTVFFESFNSTFDPSFIKTHDHYLRNIMNLGMLFMQEGRHISEDQCSSIVEQSLSKHNRESLGIQALEFLSQFARSTNPQQTMTVYRRIRTSLVDYTRDQLPVIFDPDATYKEIDIIKDLASKVFSLIQHCGLLDPLQLIFPLIRNKRAFRAEISSVISEIMNPERHDLYSQLMSNVNFCLSIFRDSSLSESFDNNIRFAIIDRILLPLLEGCPSKVLVDVFAEIYDDFAKLLEQQVTDELKVVQRVLLTGEKGCAFRVFELLFRRIGSAAIKDDLHSRIIGESTQKNEITKRMITLCTSVKKPHSRKDLASSISRDLESAKETGRTISLATDIVFQYYCSAFNCQVSVFLNTQTKESVFCNHLLTSKPAVGDLVLANIIDSSKAYNFSVTTNFKSENLLEYYKTDKTEENRPRYGVRQFVAKLTADSLFTQTLTRGRLVPHGLDDPANQRRQMLEIIGSNKDDEPNDMKGNAMDIEEPSNSSQDARLEMDAINSQLTMRSFIRLVDFMHSQFDAPDLNDQSPMPEWINMIIRMFSEHTNLNQRVFLLKLVMNRLNVFKPFRRHFNQYFLEYLANGTSQGLGFHYFLRDVCTSIISLNSEDDRIALKTESPLLSKLCYEGVKSLCKKLADESKPIFMLNIDIFQRLCHLMRKSLILDDGLTLSMLIYTEKTDSVDAPKVLSNTSVLWRLAAISILETAVYEDIELGVLNATGGRETISGSGGSADISLSQMVSLSQPNSTPTQSIHSRVISSSLSMDIESEGKILTFHDKILKAVLMNMREKKKVLCSAAFRLAGLYLNYLAGRLPFSHSVYEPVRHAVLAEIESIISKDSFNLEVNICELCKVFPEICLDTRIRIQLTSFVSKTSNKLRGYVFNSMQTVISKCLEKPEVMQWVADDIILTLRSNTGKILLDSETSNIREFFVLLTGAVKLQNKYLTELLEDNMERFSQVVPKLLKDEDLIVFFDFIMLVNEIYKSNFAISIHAKKHMIHGLSHPNESVRRMFFDWLKRESRALESEQAMLQFILLDLYNSEYEQHWLTTSASLILELTQVSPQVKDLIFDRPLQGYASSGMFSFSNRLNIAYQFSQPLIPMSLVTPSQTDSKISGERNFQQLLTLSGGRADVLKVKAKYLAEENSEEKINSVLNDDTPISVHYQASEFADPSVSKLSVHTLAKTFKPQMKAKTKANLSSFLRQNRINFNQVSQLDDNKLRILDNYGARQDMNQASFQIPNAAKDSLHFSVRTLREYKKGELPDIQISFIDILKPLKALAAQDPKMAQLIFVPLFIEVHQNDSTSSSHQNLKKLLGIINQSDANFQVINTVQSVLYELSLHSASLEVDPATIAKTGTGSLSYGGAALLLEDMLARLQRDLAREVDIVKPTQIVKQQIPAHSANSYKDDEKFAISIDDPQSIKLILNLVEIYKLMNEDDVLRGLYRLIHANDKQANDVFDLKMGKKTILSLKKLEELIKSRKELNLSDDMLDEYLAQEVRENLFTMNRWADLVENLSRDPEYAPGFSLKDNRDSESQMLVLSDASRLQKNDRYYLIRGMLNDDNYWEALRDSVESLMADSSQKMLLEKDHPYELSLLSLVMNEFDRSKFYLEKFKDKFFRNWSGVKDFSSLETRTEVISDLLRQHELKEFLICTRHFNLDGMADSPDLDRFCQTLEGWLKIDSNSTLENFKYLCDSYHSRCLFMDIMKQRYDDQYSEDRYSRHRIQVGLDYAKGLLKMGHVDTAERALSTAYSWKEKRLSSDISLTCDLVSLIVKSKLDGIARDINFISRRLDESNINAKFLSSRFDKVTQIIESSIGRSTGLLNFAQELQLTLLHLDTRGKEITAMKDYIGPTHASAEVENQYLQMIQKTLPIINEKLSSFASIEAFESMIGQDDTANREMKVKLIQKGADITESFLRWFKAKAEEKGQSLRSLSMREPERNILEAARELVGWVSDLAKQGHMSHPKLLFLLEIVTEFGDELSDQFLDCFKDVPVWIFLKWLPQIMSYLIDDKNEFYLPIIEKLLSRYPEPVIYALSVATDESTSVRQPSKNIRAMADLLRSQSGKFSTQLKFIRAMECLLHPDQRLKAWLDLMEENINDPERLKTIASKLMADMFSQSDELLGQGFGEFNKKFSAEIYKRIITLFGERFENIGRMKPDTVLTGIQELYNKAENICKGKSMGQASSYKTKLSAFSSWLSEYDINNYRRFDMRLEVPGQYRGDVEPVPELHVQVSYFVPEILVIQSIRRPKRLTMLGTDEKVYHCLVKGGEDLRLDQRIEQLFSIMNDVFSHDVDCSKREFRIGTFNVIPVKKNLGVMEWVKNTTPLKSVIEKEMSKSEDLLNNKASIKRIGLLKQLAKGKDIREQHLALLSADRELIVKDFVIQCKHFKHNYLKVAIKKKVQNAEQFVKLRKQFVSNYAVLSLGSYILGVGDRHLDNFLFDYVNGVIVPIDFGYSFGFGIGLYIPELMPFRLTQNFMELLYPLGVEGIFRNSMVYAMKALKANQHIIVDTCGVFIRDPLIDWVKIAKGKAAGKSSQIMDEVASAYPKDKLKVVRDKLMGVNPVTVTLHELSLTRHKGAPYYRQLETTVKGDTHRVRSSMGTGILPICEQIDALVDMATDPDILGRSWSGWAPYA
jgi:hypothetical protein